MWGGMWNGSGARGLRGWSMREFMGTIDGRKVRYASAMVEALVTVPEPLAHI